MPEDTPAVVQHASVAALLQHRVRESGSQDAFYYPDHKEAWHTNYHRLPNLYSLYDLLEASRRSCF